MTLTRKHEEFTATSGQVLFMEQYREKFWRPDVWMWRYGSATTEDEDGNETLGTVWSEMLCTRPNKQRLIERF